MAKKRSAPVVFSQIQRTVQTPFSEKVDVSSKEVTAMRDLHLMDELKSEPGWAFLYAAFFIGIVVFALMTAGFMD